MNTLKRNTIIDQIRNRVNRVNPQAGVVLFGSRARGDERNDSLFQYIPCGDHKLFPFYEKD